MAFSRWRAHSTNTDSCVDDNFFHRVSRGQLGVPDGERNFSAGNSRASYRNFLCNWNADWRGRRTAAVRMDYRHRIDYRVVHRIFGGGGINDFRGGD